jgi:GNAT superfamily N-acetyltransferase
MPDPIDPMLLARCLENTLERSRRSARDRDGRLLVEGDGLLLIAAEDLPWITGATITRVPADPAAALARAGAFFDRRGMAWGLTAAGDVAAAIAPAVEAAGLLLHGRRPGMLLAPIGGAMPDVPGLVIDEVRDLAALNVFIAASAAGFDGDEGLFQRAYPPKVLAAPDVTLYVGRLDGEPVATAVRGISHRIAGIGGVSTVPAARRRGIGEAITRRAALDGAAEGCIASFLGATALGYSLYERMGYRHVIDFHIWDAPAGTAD